MLHTIMKKNNPTKQDINLKERPMKITNNFEFDELWKFYLEANFLYDQKLKLLGDNLDEIKKTWNSLINSSEEISYTTLRKAVKGTASNSLSLILYYESTWIFQHMVSKRNPKGMIEVLQDTCKWLYRNPESEFTKFYWRPNNLVPEFMFTSMSKYFQEMPSSFLYELFNYFEFKISHVIENLRISEKYQSKIAVKKQDLSEIADLLRINLPPLILGSDALNKEDLLLPKTENAFARNYLKRTRNFIFTKKDEKVVAIASVEDSSLGLNLSYYFNKFNIYYLSPNYSDNEKLEIIESLLFEISDYYTKIDRKFLVTMCNEEITNILIKLGINPIKQYKCLSLAKRDSNGDTKYGGFYQAIAFLKDFYKQRLSRK